MEKSVTATMMDFLKARWENLVMINYAVDPDVLQSYLPKGVELDYYQDKTYVSLVGFMFKDTRIFNVPVPLLGTFEEVNLRFYVKRAVGNETRRGVVFISEIIPDKIVAWTANLLYHEHYSCFPTKHEIIIEKAEKKVAYKWLVNKTWNSINVKAKPVSAMRRRTAWKSLFSSIIMDIQKRMKMLHLNTGLTIPGGRLTKYGTSMFNAIFKIYMVIHSKCWIKQIRIQ
jgi:hypothetical protein